jgi:hypothetical protein
MAVPAWNIDPLGIGRGSFLNHLNTQAMVDKEVRDILRQAAKDIGKEMTRIPPKTFAARVRLAQYETFRDVVQAHEATSWSRIGESIRGNVGLILDDATNGAIALAEMFGESLAPELARGVVAAAETSAERVAARIRGRIDLSFRVYRNAALASGKIDRIVNTGIAGSKSAREIARDVIGYISPNVPGGQSYAAMRLARTELNNAFHGASSLNYQEQPWVEAVKWQISGSHPKPDICNEYAESNPDNLGQGIYLPLNVPGKPHPQCLCSIIPCTSKIENFLDSLMAGRYDSWLAKNGEATIL